MRFYRFLLRCLISVMTVTGQVFDAVEISQMRIFFYALKIINWEGGINFCCFFWHAFHGGLFLSFTVLNGGYTSKLISGFFCCRLQIVSCTCSMSLVNIGILLWRSWCQNWEKKTSNSLDMLFISLILMTLTKTMKKLLSNLFNLPYFNM